MTRTICSVQRACSQCVVGRQGNMIHLVRQILLQVMNMLIPFINCKFKLPHSLSSCKLLLDSVIPKFVNCGYFSELVLLLKASFCELTDFRFFVPEGVNVSSRKLALSS